MYLKVSSAKLRPFCSRGDESTADLVWMGLLIASLMCSKAVPWRHGISAIACICGREPRSILFPLSKALSLLCRKWARSISPAFSRNWLQQLLTLGRTAPIQAHDDVIKWTHFPRYWPFVRGIHQWIPHTKAGDAKLCCFLWSAPELTVE